MFIPEYVMMREEEIDEVYGLDENSPSVRHTSDILTRNPCGMTREEKIIVLQKLSMKATQHGVMLCGPTEKGYYWSCENHGLAKHLLRRLLTGIESMKLETTTFPHRFQPEDGAMLIIEPVDD